MTGDRPWLDPSLAPEERATLPVAAMSVEQKVAQLHGSMDTIDIYGLSGDELAEGDQYDVKRHVAGDETSVFPGCV